MPDLNETTHTEKVEVEDELEVDCEKDHVEDIDKDARIILSTFSTIRSKMEDVARAESDLRRFELSIDAERKRLQKNFEGAKAGLKGARVQMAAELAKLDAVGFGKVAQIVKEAFGA